MFLLWGLFGFAETQSGRADTAGSRSEHASGAVGERQNRRFEPSVGGVFDRSSRAPRDERRAPKAPGAQSGRPDLG